MAAATFVQTIGSASLAAFGFLALLIAALGVYGVVSGHFAARRYEMAVRVALGATPLGVAAAVARPAARVTLLGLSVGLVLAVWSSYLLRDLLLGLPPADPLSLAGASALLAAAAASASVSPLCRAARLNPATTLRSM